MGKVLDMVIKFVKYFICKWFATRVIERIVILLLEELVKRTDSKLDDRIYQAVFEEVENRAQGKKMTKGIEKGGLNEKAQLYKVYDVDREKGK